MSLVVDGRNVRRRAKRGILQRKSGWTAGKQNEQDVGAMGHEVPMQCQTHHRVLTNGQRTLSALLPASCHVSVP
jgi:hypothetical protein